MRTPLRLLLSLCLTASLFAQDIVLPAPQKTGGMPLMEALSKRATSRAFDASKELSQAQLSNLLWAAWGINRPDGHRTAPSARNWQENDLYILLKSGVFLYDAKGHKLIQLLAEDTRPLGGMQPFVKDAPVTVLIVADLSKTQGNPEGAKSMVNVDAGFISQNMYLYCASEGLSTGVRAMVDRKALSEKLKLKAEQYIVVAQSVGHFKK